MVLNLVLGYLAVVFSLGVVYLTTQAAWDFLVYLWRKRRWQKTQRLIAYIERERAQFRSDKNATAIV